MTLKITPEHLKCFDETQKNPCAYFTPQYHQEDADYIQYKCERCGEEIQIHYDIRVS
jgi:PHP family Zn ribbon phosphoesterase